MNRRLNYATALFGQDYFISYSRRDASGYVSALERELGSQAFSSFIDIKEIPKEIVGENDIKNKLRKGIKRSRYRHLCR